MAPLFLTAEEKKVFDTLPEAIRSGVIIDEEKMTFADSEISLGIRMRNLNLEHTALKTLQEESKKKQYTPEEAQKLAETVELSGLSQHDMTELAFAWGPTVFTHLIGLALPAISSKEDLADLGNLAGIRHGLLLSLTMPALA